jgi:hypothetical protein
MEEEAVESRKKKWLNEYLNKLSIHQISLVERKKQLGKSEELKDSISCPLHNRFILLRNCSFIASALSSNCIFTAQFFLCIEQKQFLRTVIKSQKGGWKQTQSNNKHCGITMKMTGRKFL